MNGDGMTEAQSERLVAAFERIAAALERTYLPATLPSPSPLTSPFTPYELAPTYADGRRLTYQPLGEPLAGTGGRDGCGRNRPVMVLDLSSDEVTPYVSPSPCQPFGGTVCSLPVGTVTHHHAREGEIR